MRKCLIVQIDHEELFDLHDTVEDGETIPKKELIDKFIPVANNFYEFLESEYNR